MFEEEKNHRLSSSSNLPAAGNYKSRSRSRQRKDQAHVQEVNMINTIKWLLMLTIGLYWALLWILSAFIDLLRVGPRKLFYKPGPLKPPANLSDPAYGEHVYTVIGSVKLHYVVSGPENGPLMLMLHGFPEFWYSWRYQIKEFQRDFRVVALDMRGYGDSDKPQGIENYKMELLIEDVRSLIAALDYRSCILVSHDWGGGVAWAFAAHHPQMVEKLVVMNIPPVSIWRNGFTSITRPMQFLSSGYIYLFQLPYLPEFLSGLNDLKLLDLALLGKQYGVQSGLFTEEDLQCYKYSFRKPVALTAGINYYRANLSPPGYKHEFKYSMPVKIIWGCKDIAVTMTLLEDTLKVIPHADVTKIEEASHWVQMDQPERVNSSIREFLKKTAFNASK